MARRRRLFLSLAVLLLLGAASAHEGHDHDEDEESSEDSEESNAPAPKSRAPDPALLTFLANAPHTDVVLAKNGKEMVSLGWIVRGDNITFIVQSLDSSKPNGCARQPSV